jgi:DNA polymerase III sliding clamp (beta) subunit (PCNA family)
MIALDVDDLESDGKSTSIEVIELKKILAGVKPGETGKVCIETRKDSNNLEQMIIIGKNGVLTIRCDSKEETETIRDFIFRGLEKFSTVEPIQAAGFFDAVKSVAFCSSSDEARPVLQGVRLNGSIAATDGFRIARNLVKYEGLDCIIPGFFLAKAGKILGKDVKIQRLEQTICISDENAITACELIDGNFPDWAAIYPKNWWMRCVVDRSQLVEGLRLSLTTHRVFGGNNVVKFTFHEDSLKLTSNVEGEGSSVTSLITTPRIAPVEEIPEDKKFVLPFNIAANARMLKEIVERVSGELVVLKFHANNTPIVIESEREEADAGYALMPMHLG